MPFNMPEVREHKEKLLLGHLKYIKDSFHAPKNGFSDDPAKQIIIGPAFFSLVMSNFVFGHLLQADLKVDFDDEFYERYTNTITNLFLFGITGLSKASKRKMIKIKK
jgi:hypothetical protein